MLSRGKMAFRLSPALTGSGRLKGDRLIGVQLYIHLNTCRSFAFNSLKEAIQAKRKRFLCFHRAVGNTSEASPCASHALGRLGKETAKIGDSFLIILRHCNRPELQFLPVRQLPHLSSPRPQKN